MADTAVETVLGIIEGQGGTSTARTLVPALVDLGEIIAGGGGELPDGSVTTDKLADAAVTTEKIAADAVLGTQIKDGAIIEEKIADYEVTYGKLATSAVNAIRTIDIHSADATVAAALSQMGVETSITPPESMIDPSDMTGEWTDGLFHLCWLNASSQFELAPIVVESTAGGGLMAYAIGKDSTASGLMGVDTAWTVTANSSGGGTIADSSVTTAKLADGAVTFSKLASDAISGINIIDIHSADATVQAALEQMGVTTNVTSPALMITQDMDGEWTDPHFRLCWLSPDSKLELAPIVVESNANNNLIAYAIGKDSTASGVMGYDSTWTVTANSSGGGGTQTTWYGTSTTTAGTADKAVTCDGFELKRGAMIAVYFGKANTANTPKLNVNSTGAKPIYYNNTALSNANPLLWGAGVMLTFVCDGTNFHLLNRPTNAYGISSTAAGTANKETQDSIKALVVNGTMVSVLFSTKNTVANAIYLNVDGTGNSKMRGANGSDTSSSNTLFWDDNTVLTFIRNGSNWMFVSASKELPTTAPA